MYDLCALVHRVNFDKRSVSRTLKTKERVERRLGTGNVMGRASGKG